MKAPPDDMPRDLDAILAAAVELINPDAVGLFQATLETAISTVRGIHERAVNLPSPAEMKSDVADYLKALRAARKKAYAVAPFYWSADFAAALDQETREVKARAGFPVPHGAQPRDLTADMAAHAARGLLEARFIFPKDRDDKDPPGIKNPWRRGAPLTEGGLWPELAALIYEAVTGRDNHDMMPACRQTNEVDAKGRPELLLRLPYSSTPRPRRPKSRRPKSRRSTAARR
jgi:hypothetical protein